MADDRETTDIFLNLVSHGDFEIVKRVVEQCPGSINLHEEHCCALKIAAEYGYMDMVKYFVEEKGMDVTLNDCFPLRAAVQNNEFEIVKYLAEHGSYYPDDYEFAIDRAIENGSLDIIKYLVENLGVVIKKDQLRFIKEEDEEMKRYLIK
jgi:predicted metalloprotease with PDZ domain